MMKPADALAGPKKNDGSSTTETVADILDREVKHVISEWLARVQKESDLMHIKLNHVERTGHLPYLLHDVVLRYKQGYTVAMMVEESRLLQVSIFTTLHQNVKQLEFGALLPDVVTIADEVDAQLKEQMLRFMAAGAAESAKGK